MRPLLLKGRGGLGDAIYARPFVREATRHHTQVFVETSWPEIFADLPRVQCVKRLGGLAVQAWHGERAPAVLYVAKPRHAEGRSLKYSWKGVAAGRSIWTQMREQSKLRPAVTALDLPPLPVPDIAGCYAVVRPPAIRCDYPAPSREPLPEYLATAASMLRERGYLVVTLGWWVPGLEEPNGDVPADVRYENGEVTLMQALGLVAHASVVVSAPCWMIPACIASRTPHIVIAGGCGGRNNPIALVDERFNAPTRWMLPETYCMCGDRFHECPKVIDNFAGRFAAELDRLRGRVAA